MPYNASIGTLSNKPYSPSSGVPTDGRAYFYDSVNFKWRPFQSTSEVISYLDTSAKRVGHVSVWVNSGGTLNGDGSFTGGTYKEYMFRNGVTNSDLIEIPILTSQEKTDLANLSTVATSGSYSDLEDTPTLGSSATLDVASSGNATSGQVVKGSDSRLSDARTPLSHTQSADTVTDGTVNKAYSATEKTKLSGIATGATANRTDAATDDEIDLRAADAVAIVVDGAPEEGNTLNKLYTLTTDTEDIGVAFLAFIQTLPGWADSPSVVLAGNGTFVPRTGNLPPTATGVLFNSLSVPESEGSLFTGDYTYNDTESNPEGTTTFQWYRADDDTGTGRAPISGATAITYTLTTEDIDKVIQFGVTPVATAGEITGLEVLSAYSGVIAAVAAQNLITWSNAFNDSSWEKLGASSVVSNNLAGPDGVTMDGSTFTGGTSAYGGLLRKSFIYTAEEFTDAVDVKYTNHPYFGIRMDAWGLTPFINLTTDVIEYQEVVGLVITIEALGNGWKRIHYTYTHDAIIGDYFDMCMVSATGEIADTYDGSKTIGYRHASVRHGGPGPYNETTSSIIP